MQIQTRDLIISRNYTNIQFSRMDYELFIIILLISLVITFSLKLNKQYTKRLQTMTHYPIVRFLAGMVVVCMANINPLFGILSLIIVFFWMTDVHLLSDA